MATQRQQIIKASFGYVLHGSTVVAIELVMFGLLAFHECYNLSIYVSSSGRLGTKSFSAPSSPYSKALLPQ
jgi:hypothetical protein